jgi:hypothetical protein
VQAGDILAIASRTETLIEDASLFGSEVSDRLSWVSGFSWGLYLVSWELV